MEIRQRTALKNRCGKVGVLMGGPSSEREISLKSGKAVYESLKDSGFDVVTVDIVTDDIKENVRLIKSHKIDCAFLALHGRFGEDGQMQRLLEQMSIVYTGPGPRASALAMDKVESRRIFEANRLNVPRYRVLYRQNAAAHFEVGRLGLSLPLVIKPASGGSSMGLSIIDNCDELGAALEAAFNLDEKVIVEEFITGREVTVGILDQHPLPLVEIVPKKRFFDFEAKYLPGMTEYIVPAQIPKAFLHKAENAALAAYNLLGCRGCSRVDLIIDERGEPFILELNTIPGFTQTSLLPKAARCAGIEFAGLCVELIKLAYEKRK